MAQQHNNNVAQSVGAPLNLSENTSNNKKTSLVPKNDVYKLKLSFGGSLSPLKQLSRRKRLRWLHIIGWRPIKQLKMGKQSEERWSSFFMMLRMGVTQKKIEQILIFPPRRLNTFCLHRWEIFNFIDFFLLLASSFLVIRPTHNEPISYGTMSQWRPTARKTGSTAITSRGVIEQFPRITFFNRIEISSFSEWTLKLITLLYHGAHIALGAKIRKRETTISMEPSR